MTKTDFKQHLELYAKKQLESPPSPGVYETSNPNAAERKRNSIFVGNLPSDHDMLCYLQDHHLQDRLDCKTNERLVVFLLWLLELAVRATTSLRPPQFLRQPRVTIRV